MTVKVQKVVGHQEESSQLLYTEKAVKKVKEIDKSKTEKIKNTIEKGKGPGYLKLLEGELKKKP